jgi:capsular polysaccharide biosynthesis protein
MDLRDYAAIILRRWWIVAIFTVAALGLSLLLAPRVETRYVSSVRLAISLRGEPVRDDVFGYDKFYAFQAAEFMIDDFAEIVKSRAFADDVAAVINDPSITPGMIQGTKSTDKTHRVMTLRVSGSNPDQVTRIAAGAVTVLDNRAPFYFRQLDVGDAQVRVIDPPSLETVEGGNRFLIDVAIRTALGFIVGLALVLFLHYLDTAIYSRRDAEQLALPIMGELPPDALAGTRPA